LVTYATWTGATRAVANYVGDVIHRHSLNADVLAINAIDSLSDYDCSVVRSSIHARQVMKEFTKFLKINKREIKNKPHAFFIVCSNTSDDKNTNRPETISIMVDESSG